MNTVLIAFTGKRMSGKTTMANYLCHRYGFKKHSFATPMKRMLVAMGVEPEYVYGDKKEDVIPQLGVTGRYALQQLGTAWGRDIISPDIWVNAMLNDPVFQQDSIAYGAVTDDVRFPNEAAAIRRFGGVVIQLIREGQPGVGDEADAHISEKPIEEFDYQIVGSSNGLGEMYQKIDQLLIDLKVINL